MSVSPTALTPMMDNKTAMKTANTLSCGGITERKETCIETIHAIRDIVNMIETAVFDTSCSGGASSSIQPDGRWTAGSEAVAEADDDRRLIGA